MSKFFMVDMKKAKLESLRRILVHEKEGGFMDSAVIGGLDLFLHRWTNELSSVLGVLNSYSVLTRPKRESWVNDVLVRLDGASTSLLHVLDVPSEAQIKLGLRVRVRWADKTVGYMTDIACFELEKTP